MRELGIAKLFEEEIVENAIVNISELRSPSGSSTETQFIGGFVYVLPRGHGVVITASMNTYHLPIRLIGENKLESGDYIETKCNDYAVIEILKCNEKRPSPQTTRPTRAISAGDVGFKLGQRVLLTTSNAQFDFIEYISDMAKSLDGRYRVALVVDESNDCAEFLLKNGMDEVYMTRVNHNTKKKVLFALSALFVAKQHANNGKDVVLFIDNLNKLFHVYNQSIYEQSITDVKELNIGPYTDLKNLFFEAKQIHDGGSITNITNFYKNETDMEKFIYSDFSTLCNIVHEII